MKIFLTIFCIVVSSITSAELVRLDFKVTDNFGQPVKDATIRIRSKNKPWFLYDEPKDKNMKCTTDKNGEASERFFYWGSDIFCYVTCEGYYDEKIPRFRLKSHFDQKALTTTVLEDERLIPVVLRKKINPVPLFAHRGSGQYVSFGTNDVTVGFDLKCFSPVEPYGEGETADFYVHHKLTGVEGARTCVAELTFPPGGGAYVVKETSGASHPIVYAADTNKVFISSFTREYPRRETGHLSPRMGGVILNDDETLVLRTRAVLDDKGNVVSANYSKIYGPLSICQCLIYGQSCFNPNVNETNLEFDKRNNLSKREGGVFYP